MDDLIRRSDAIESFCNKECSWGISHNFNCDCELKNTIKAIPAVEPKPVLTEEVREAIMRLTMCARHECAICKLSNNEDDCYEIATKRMHILVDAFDKPKQGEWIDIWEDGRSTKAVCNTCGRVSDRPLGDFCKWCGVTMKGADDED